MDRPRWRRGERCADDGASAVEFALILPLLVVLIFGMIEFGLAFNAYITVTHAAREGARMAVVGTYSVAKVRDRAAPLPPDEVSVQMTDPGFTGEYYTVTVTYPYHLMVPLWGDGTVTLTSTAKMRKE